MATILYQIGDLPVYDVFAGVLGKGVQLDLGRDWENPSAAFTNIGGTLSFLPATRSIPKQPSMSIKTPLLQAGALTPQEAIEHLKSLGGRRDVTVIAFRYQDYDSTCCDCTYPLEWIVTTATILSVKEEYEFKADKAPYVFSVSNIDIKLEIALNWRILSSTEWEYRDYYTRFVDPYSDLNTQQGFGSVLSIPQHFDKLKVNSFFFKWQTANSRLSPTFWAEKYTGNSRGGYGSDYAPPGITEFFIDPQKYSGSPSSFYAFTNLTTSGEITISINRDTGVFFGQTVLEVSRLDLAQLNTDLLNSGYSGLLIGDIVYTGNVDPFPAFIVRGSEVLDALPKWSYPGTQVGELGRGYARITIESKNAYCLVAQIHEFGVL